MENSIKWKFQLMNELINERSDLNSRFGNFNGQTPDWVHKQVIASVRELILHVCGKNEPYIKSLKIVVELSDWYFFFFLLEFIFDVTRPGLPRRFSKFNTSGTT